MRHCKIFLLFIFAFLVIVLLLALILYFVCLMIMPHIAYCYIILFFSFVGCKFSKNCHPFRHIYNFMNHADSVPLISSVISAFATASFVLTSIAAGLLTISTASLQSVGTFMGSSSFLIVDPARNLFVSI